MRNITLEELLEAGCHFGHQVTRQNPKAREFIFEARDGIHIIDLEKTKEGLEEAGKFVKELAQKGGTMLVLGTKKQAQAVLREEMKRVTEANTDGLFFVTQRWIGGTLTNFQEVSKNYKKLKDITSLLQNDYEKAKYTKKELGDFDKDRQKLQGFYGGTSDMTKAPNALFIIDTHTEHVAVAEALRMGVPTVGITDTNADPLVITHPIPANDDAKGSLELIVKFIIDTWIEGRKEMGKVSKSEDKKEEANEGENTTAKKKETVTSDKPLKTIKKTKKEEAEEKAN